MIQYSFPITQPQNFKKITSLIESHYSILMHTENPLPSSLTYINGNVALSSSPQGTAIYVNFYESTDNYQLKDSSGNVIYQSQPLSTIPTQTQIQNAIGDLL